VQLVVKQLVTAELLSRAGRLEHRQLRSLSWQVTDFWASAMQGWAHLGIWSSMLSPDLAKATPARAAATKDFWKCILTSVWCACAFLSECEIARETRDGKKLLGGTRVGNQKGGNSWIWGTGEGKKSSMDKI